jgi:hypothetical protein
LGDLLSENNARTVSKPPAEARIAMGGVALKPRGLCFNIQRGNSMRKVIRGYAKGKNLNLILIGTIPVPHSKDKCSPAAPRLNDIWSGKARRSLKKKLYVSRPYTARDCAVTASQLVALLSHGQVESDFCGSIALGRPERHKSR